MSQSPLWKLVMNISRIQANFKALILSPYPVALRIPFIRMVDRGSGSGVSFS